MSGICDTTASILVASTSSGASRKVFHGVGGVQPLRARVKAAGVQPLALGEADARGLLDDVVDLPDVVVPAVEDARDVAAAQLAVGHVQPPVQAAGHLQGEPAVDRAVLLAHRVEVLGGPYR